MKVTLTGLMGIDLEKHITIDMHKSLGKISNRSNPKVYVKLEELLNNMEQMSFDTIHCMGYVGSNKENIVPISLCKGLVKKITSLHLEYECLIVGRHTKIYPELKATSLTMHLYYNSMNNDFYEKILKETGKIYEINKKSEVLMSYKKNNITITVNTLKEPAHFSKLIELVTYMYEVVYLTEGFFPKRIGMSTKLTTMEEETQIYYRFDKCYQGHKSMNTEIGAQIFKRDTILKEWILFRKKTDSLFDYYLYATNSLQFIDVDLFHLITVLEGYSKYTEVINNVDIRNKKNNNRRQTYVKLYDRLQDLASTTPECQIIFATQIEEKQDYLLRLVDHRNDFSHQFQYKKPFDEEEMREFYHKINLLLRVLFFREVGVDVQDRQIRAIIRKYFNTRSFLPAYNRVLKYDGVVASYDENGEEYIEEKTDDNTNGTTNSYY